MNTIDRARTAYAAAARPIRTHRGTEYEAFADITARLRTGIRSGATGFSSFVQALNDNRRLWTLLAADVAEPQNALPQTLRAQIFYLAEFTLQHTSKVLAGSATPEALIDVNLAVMGGLRGERAAA